MISAIILVLITIFRTCKPADPQEKASGAYSSLS